MNGLSVSQSYLVKNSDLISHKIHRHEPPVSSSPVEIIFKDADMLVVDKASTVPVPRQHYRQVHPSGKYNLNSLTEILREKFKLKHISCMLQALRQ